MAKLTDKNRLSITHPELCKEWDYEKNGDLKPEDVSYGSTLKVWWKCKNEHEWEARVKERGKGEGCPYCCGKRVSEKNCLQTLFPELCKEWNYAKNGILTPENISYGSSRKVWWKCKNGHEWEATVSERASGKNKCTKCNSIAITHPELCKEWNYAKNGDLTPENVSRGRSIKVWWKCKNGHEWESVVSERVKSWGKCTKCNSIVMTHPELCKEWNHKKNGILTPQDISYGSGKKVWWKCKNGHEWEATVADRSKEKFKNNCPYCSGRRYTEARSLAFKFPDIAKEWHPTKNGELTPKDISYTDKTRVWWKCKNGHEWVSNAGSRSYANTQCPYCCNLKTNDDNCLSAIFPDIAKEWHPTKNDKLTPQDVVGGCSKRVWWKCKNGHEWQTTIANRTGQQTQCPYCRGVNLKDGTCCASVPEAIIYLQYKKEKKKFLHNKKYGGTLKNSRYDFYLIEENTYVEVTSYGDRFSSHFTKERYIEYLRKIVKKRRYVENVLKAKFQFIQFTPNRHQREEVLKNIK
jgi:hypothetical protein